MATLQVDDRIAAALRAQAEARGMSLDAYLQMVAQARQPDPPAVTDSDDVRQFDAALDELFTGDSRPLPAVTIQDSRQDIYFNHD